MRSNTCDGRGDRLEAARRSLTPVSLARSGAWTVGLIALLVLACQDSSAPIIAPIIGPPAILAPQLAFVEVRGEFAGIVVVDSTGSGVRLSPVLAWDKDPAWSPDGSRIAFTSGQNNGKSDIYIMNADGGNRVRLTTDESGNSRPAWSHDGARIAFVSRRDGNSEIYVMNADGSHQSRLTLRDTSDDTSPTWSPDGTRIAFSTCEHGLSGYCETDNGTSGGILAITVDGGETVQLTSNYSDTAPAWSPDGSRIAFSSLTGGTRVIFVVNPDGAGRAPYSPYGFGATDPSWSPDGTKIAFAVEESCNDTWDCFPGEILIVGPGAAIYSVPNRNSLYQSDYPSDPAWRP